MNYHHKYSEDDNADDNENITEEQNFKFCLHCMK